MNNVNISEVKNIVAYYTLAAAATGAIPVPATSAAIIGENSIMVSHIASKLGANISVASIGLSLGVLGTVNAVGRAVFIEGAKLLSWGTGQWWAMPLLMAFGASTAGLQTYIVGMIAIEIGRNGGLPLLDNEVNAIIQNAKISYPAFLEEAKKNPPKPV